MHSIDVRSNKGSRDFLDSCGAEGRMYESEANLEILRWVPDTAKEVLDLGCGSGANAAILKMRGIRVDGVTISHNEAKQASVHCRQVFVHDLERGLPAGVARHYDAILCSHVLEHICFPSQLLDDIADRVGLGGRAIIAVPNLMFYKSRAQLLLGRFEYTERGIMDSTHFRWYTLSTLSRLLEGHRFRVECAYGDGNAPLGRFRRIAPSLCNRIDKLACARFPGLFGLQLLVVATCKHG